ncbi:hypothetical protein M436DRAFT_85813 [Aureobasidium namibiae CBS 147.97]|uniref:DASH complex subunit DAD4 n=4 Tax=Aureobasidium TaxID=5579 RepID=A0A074W7S8_9PEZI
MTQSIAVAILGLVPAPAANTAGRARRIHQSINMESPHEHQQNVLLSRIITNVEKLNEAVMMLNKSLQEININNMDVELVAQMFKNYQSNVLFHLEATDNLREAS